MRFWVLTFFALAAGPAAAHVGHLGDVAGHDHWVAGAAIGLAAGIALWGKYKDAKSKSSETHPEADQGQEESA